MGSAGTDWRTHGWWADKAMSDTRPLAESQAVLSPVIGEPQIEIVADDAELETTNQGAQVFAGAATYRPITMAVLIAAAVIASYGVYAIVSLLVPGDATEPRRLTSPPVARIVGAVAETAPATSCPQVSVSTFLDVDGNGRQGPEEAPISGVTVVANATSGPVTGRTASNGQVEIALAGDPATLALVDMPHGLWPGPRLPNHAGESVGLSEDCGAALGFVWIPVGAVLPVAFISGPATPGVVPDEVPPAVEARSGVQVQGRVWSDADGDGVFGPGDRGIGGVLLELIDDEERVLAAVTTRPGGTYSFANLAPHTVQGVRSRAFPAETMVRAMGVQHEDPAQTGWFRTGDAGFSVWGLDFELPPS